MSTDREGRPYIDHSNDPTSVSRCKDIDLSMPELPEVELVRRQIFPRSIGRRFIAINVRDERILDGISPSELSRKIIGHEVVDISRRGKQLMVILDDGSVLAIHLGMTGELEIVSKWREGRYLRAWFEMDDDEILMFHDQRKFGGIGMYPSIEGLLILKGLGPDALTIRSSDLSRRVRDHHRAIKAVLLDQKVLAGIGNLYSDEVLFQCGIHPEARSDQIDERRLVCLHRALRRVLKRSISVGSDFSQLPFGYLLRHRSPGGMYPKCGTIWANVRSNGRTAYFCPMCQKL
jgi:formamidopyrimidine-DNA glycosylase